MRARVCKCMSSYVYVHECAWGCMRFAVGEILFVLHVNACSCAVDIYVIMLGWCKLCTSFCRKSGENRKVENEMKRKS